MILAAKNRLQPFMDATTQSCSVKCHKAIHKADSHDNEYRQWDKDGPNGEKKELNSMSVLLDWWTTQGNYAMYRGHKDTKGTRKEDFHKDIQEMMRSQGVVS